MMFKKDKKEQGVGKMILRKEIVQMKNKQLNRAKKYCIENLKQNLWKYAMKQYKMSK